MIVDMFDRGPLPVLQRVVQFTEARQKVLADNIANLDTPYFKPRDLDPGSFQASLRDAIDQRRTRPNPVSGPLNMRDTREMAFRDDGIDTRPGPRHDNLLFHDQNNRDLDRLMQDVTENAMTHNLAVELIRGEFDMINTAIRERI